MGCNRRSAWLSAFIGIQALGFTICLISVITPSWQYVYLEDGRTEHHHGLWLDCKRDYSNEYGRTREYYETLYRLADLQGPFDQFWLPPLLCVFKFDYWLDDEDWYEHGYDENQLQGDAYQHLFIGWKIAAFTAHCFSLVCSLSALVIMFCAFCHWILICVSAVLVSLAVIAAFAGNCVYYMFANYQDNRLIHEKDGDYQQYLGWSFYASLVGNVLLLVSSIIGCMATNTISISGRTKLVKIELGEQDRDQLLHSSAGNSSGLNPSFKRSLSAVYRIDSSALRKWEKEAMRNVQKQQQFKRANSMPNILKRSQMIGQHPATFLASQSDISSKAQTEPVDNIKLTYIDAFRSTTPHPVPILKHSSDDVVYEYVEPHSISFMSDKSYSIDRRPPLPKRPPSATALPVYDQVCDTPTGQKQEENEYLKPIQTAPSTPVGIPLSRPPQKPELQFASTVMTRQEIEERFERTNLHGLYDKQPAAKLQSSVRKAGANLPKLPPKPAARSSLRTLIKPKEPAEPPVFKINTFQYRDESGRIRSLTNLSMGEDRRNPKTMTSTAFFAGSRSPTEISSSVAMDDQRSSSSTSYGSSLRSRLIPGLKETSFNYLLARQYAQSEADRSVGSGTTFRPASPGYDLDDDRSTVTVSTNISNGSSAIGIPTTSAVGASSRPTQFSSTPDDTNGTRV